jgi:aryl-alcohol dehydrogenase-like predicted oxidoreductase
MDTTVLGRTGMKVSRLGIGLAEIGVQNMEVADVGHLLNSALDSGINFLDTAACYGISEEVIGRTVAHRRNEYYLATKCGHSTDPDTGRMYRDAFNSPESWTAEIIEDSIDRSLKRMNVDHVDLVQLHSCSLDVLKQGEVIEAIVKARDKGKTRFIGYSGDNDAAMFAITTNLFDTLQTSFNLVEQHAKSKLFDIAVAHEMGVIAKRPIANGAWGSKGSPVVNFLSGYADEYFRRAQLMMEGGPIPSAPSDRIELALGFVLAHSAVHTAIVGTTNLSHLQSNIAMVESQNFLSENALNELYRRFNELGEDWYQLG